MYEAKTVHEPKKEAANSRSAASGDSLRTGELFIPGYITPMSAITGAIVEGGFDAICPTASGRKCNFTEIHFVIIVSYEGKIFIVYFYSNVRCSFRAGG